MNTQTVSENVIRKYLLGQTSEAERLNLEERLLEDEGTYEELLILENELTDEYLRGQLSQTERKDFESHFLLTPSHQEKLRFAKVVRGHLATHATAKRPVEVPRKAALFGIPAFRNPVFSLAMAAVLTLMVAGIAWLAWRNTQNTINWATFTLTPGLVRSGDSENNIQIPANAERVRLRLVVADKTPYESYTAGLESIDGRVIGRMQIRSFEFAEGGTVVTVESPSSSLPPGEYRLKLNGVTAARETVSLGSYYFRVQPG